MLKNIFSVLFLIITIYSAHSQELSKTSKLQEAGISVGFPEDWNIDEDPEYKSFRGSSPDWTIHVRVWIAKESSVKEVLDNAAVEFGLLSEGLVISDEDKKRKVNDLQLSRASGSIENTDNGPIGVVLDVLETPIKGDNGIVVIATYGLAESFNKYNNEIDEILNSIQKEE